MPLTKVGRILARLQTTPLLLGQIFTLCQDFFYAADTQSRLLESLFASRPAFRIAGQLVTQELVVALFELGALVYNSILLLHFDFLGLIAKLFASVFTINISDQKFSKRVLVELFIK